MNNKNEEHQQLDGESIDEDFEHLNLMDEFSMEGNEAEEIKQLKREMTEMKKEIEKLKLPNKMGIGQQNHQQHSMSALFTKLVEEKLTKLEEENVKLKKELKSEMANRIIGEISAMNGKMDAMKRENTAQIRGLKEEIDWVIKMNFEKNCALEEQKMEIGELKKEIGILKNKNGDGGSSRTCKEEHSNSLIVNGNQASNNANADSIQSTPSLALIMGLHRRFLLKYFDNQPHPKKSEMEMISKHLGLSIQYITNWFHNERGQRKLPQNPNGVKNMEQIESGIEKKNILVEAAKKPKCIPNEEQLALLESTFFTSKYLTKEEREELAQKLNWPATRVKIWFCKRHYEWKRMQGSEHTKYEEAQNE